MLVLRRPHRLPLVPHVLQEQQRAVVHARQPGTETAVEATPVVLLPDLLLLSLPVHAEGRIGEEVVESLVLELILGQAVAVPDVVTAAVVVHLLHQHVGRRGGERAPVVVLPVDVEPRRPVVLAQVVLRLGQHAARATGGVEQLADGAGSGEQLVVLDEQDAHHQTDDLARREVVARGLVGQLVEAPDEVLEDEPHLLVRHRFGMQVDIGEFRDDEVEDARLAHPLDFILELEEFEDVAHIPREAIDVADEVPLDVVGIALELLEVERGAIVEALAGGSVQPQVQGCALDLAALAPRVLGQNLGLRRGEHAVEPAQHRHGQHDALVLRRPVWAAQQIGDLPDQVREVVVVRHRSAHSRRAALCCIVACQAAARLRDSHAVPGRSLMSSRCVQVPIPNSAVALRSSTTMRIAVSPGEPSNRLAASSTSGSRSRSPTVLRKIRGLASTQCTARSMSSGSSNG